MAPGTASSSSWEPPGSARRASSIVRSGERHDLEETALAAAIGRRMDHWRERGDWLKIQCAELLFVRGWPNKKVAAELNISEQAVANHKFDFLAKLRAGVRRQDLSEDIFPELYENGSG